MPKDLTSRLNPDSLKKTLNKNTADIASLGRRNKRPESLDQLTSNLGLLEYGEFRVGNGVATGSGFTGVRMLYPGADYGGDDYNIAGINNDVLQWGGRVSDGVFVAGAGAVILDANGITLDQGVTDTGAVKWVDGSDELTARIFTSLRAGIPTAIIAANPDGTVPSPTSYSEGAVAIEAHSSDGSYDAILDLSANRSSGTSGEQQAELSFGGVSAIYADYNIGALINGKVVINEDGNNIDTRIEGDTDTHMIFGDASTDNVGIGEATPLAKLHVAGEIAATVQEVTIAGGIIAATSSNIRVEGQGGAADDLDTINDAVAGAFYVIEKLGTSGTVTLKDGADNLRLAGDFALDSGTDKIVLFGRQAGASVILDELTRSNNT